MRKLLVAMLIAAASAVLATQALAATRSVKIGDDYFVRKGSAPTVTVKKGKYKIPFPNANGRYYSKVKTSMASKNVTCKGAQSKTISV